MSAGNVSAGPAGVAHRRWALSLRGRLLLGLVGLLAVVSAVVLALTGIGLRHYLVGRLDAQLTAASARSIGYTSDGDGDDDGGMIPGATDSSAPQFLLARGQAEGTLGASILGHQVIAVGVNDASGTPRQVATVQCAVLAVLPADGRQRTRTLGSLGSFRLEAVARPDGTTTVTGLPMAGVNATVTRFEEVGTGVAGGGLLVAALAGAFVIRLTLRPLRRVAATASRVSELELDRGEVELATRVPATDTDPRTEVGRVGAAVNRMLDHVGAALSARQASETRVRQFVADASHELRTPLASIRGYAELSRRTGTDVPPDIAFALRRVESESERMTALVEDLLLLARLDSGRPLADDPVDLTALVVDTVSDAHTVAPEHRWELDLPEDPVEISGDSQRLHQVLANLLANARTHTPPGTTVRVSLVEAPAEVVLRVADNGPGIPAELLPQVFERFSRGDSSRSRAAGSSGLGLSIVSAVVTSHRGTVQVTSVPGDTVFVVRLPRVQQGPGAHSPVTASA